MEKTEQAFVDFMEAVDPKYRAFVDALHDRLTEAGCKVEIKSAKSGPVVSYIKNKKTLANYVFRKKGALVRVYGDRACGDSEFMDSLPQEMAAAIEKAPLCKRLADPTACNSRCKTGYVFSMGGEECQRCRYSAFFFPLSETANPYIEAFLLKEAEIAV